MKQEIKRIGLLVILPLLLASFALYDIGEAEGLPPEDPVVRGESLPDFESLKGEPFVEIVSVKRFSAESSDISRVTIKAYAGSLDITDVQILIRSDNFTKETVSINEIQAHSFSITSVLLKVKDPNSVTTETLNYQIKAI